MHDEPSTETLLAMLATAGLGAVVVFDGPAADCPACRPVLAPAA